MKKMIILAALSSCVLATSAMAFTSQCPTTATVVNGNFVGYGPGNTKFEGPVNGQSSLGTPDFVQYYAADYMQYGTQIQCYYNSNSSNDTLLSLVSNGATTMDNSNSIWIPTTVKQNGEIESAECAPLSDCSFNVAG